MPMGEDCDDDDDDVDMMILMVMRLMLMMMIMETKVLMVMLWMIHCSGRVLPLDELYNEDCNQPEDIL